MKAIIVYYSYTGSTKKYVQKIKEILDADTLELKPKRDIKVKGLTSYVVGGLKSMKKESPELEDYRFNANDYDLIVFATPVWAYTYAPSLRSFFEKEKVTGKKVSYFFTHRGTPGKTKEKFEEALAGNQIIEGKDLNAKHPEEENMKRIEAWAEKLKSLI